MKLKIRKGLRLNIKGSIPADAPIEDIGVELCAVCPDDFPGFTPKTAVKEGDEVAAGSPLLYDKIHPEVKLVSPVPGHVKAVVRGERRKILRVEVEAMPTSAQAPDIDARDARKFLSESGLLAMMRRRPYDIVPNPDDKVRDIFVTAFDAAPLSAKAATEGYSIFEKADFEAGAALLAKVCEGKIYLCHDAEWGFGAIKGTEDVEISGPYPASNAGVAIANIAPVNKGETVWTLDLATLGRIGRLAAKGDRCFETIVAVAGPEVVKPYLAKTIIGAAVAPILKGHLPQTDKHLRVISGNVLTGTAIDPAEGYLHAPYRQISVIAEGDDVDEFMGWASLSPSKMSESRTFPGHFLKKLFSPDARLHGGRRAMIVSGQYESLMPMDILPEYLIKAILSHNIEDMEKLGIYEVAPEDFAAAEYADTSKLPLQQIVRDGLDYLRKELE
ncbi:MAG: NADH:ubiquinone reductase (Na(+)-transporting) subunit A [Bacteroidales bacterium]|nr:NADH:ubiquinone reductase (Na(+)-transporting) subunit A [Bacteroidales bacterium]